mmetsp:Transcript_50509/g.68707  ORF Transcript_50509/g.68707 Transcript_50509/m.68707 type:complete len:87 (+) Transcript_50509:244-504(+)
MFIDETNPPKRLPSLAKEGYTTHLSLLSLHRRPSLKRAGREKPAGSTRDSKHPLETLSILTWEHRRPQAQRLVQWCGGQLLFSDRR